jgi:hypothetical protein
MEEKYKKFQEFNWTNSKEWQNYLQYDLYPTPPLNKIEFFKKKFYRSKIDPDFDINYSPDITSNQNTNSQYSNRQNNTNTNYRQQNPYMNPPTGLSQNLNKILQKLEILFWVFFLISCLMTYFSLKLSAVALFIRTFRRVGMPKFNMEYAQHVFLDEHFQILLYNLLFMVDSFNLFVLIPILITCFMHFAEFMKLNNLQVLKNYYEQFYNKRVEVATIRSNLEIAIGFLLIFGIFLGLNNFLTPIFYWQFLRFKYVVNQDTKNSFSSINSYIERFKNRNNTPGFLKIIIEKVQQFTSYMGRTETTENQGAGAQNCNIF